MTCKVFDRSETGRNVSNLCYTDDDTTNLSENEEGLKYLIKGSKKFGHNLNIKKTKLVYRSK